MTEAGPATRRTVTATRTGSGRDGDGGDFTYYVVASEASTGEARGPAGRPAGGERRAGGRIRTRLRDATLSEARGRVLAECRIRDRSRHGAKLELDKACPLPRTFVLRDPAAGTSHRATLIWQKGREAGVRLSP